MTQAIVLFAHGARDPRWAEPFEAVAARVRAAAPDADVVLAFLELMAPTLGDAATRLVGAGGHLRSDLPPLVDALRIAHPGVDVHLHAAIGEHVTVVEAMAAAAVAAA